MSSDVVSPPLAPLFARNTSVHEPHRTHLCAVGEEDASPRSPGISSHVPFPSHRCSPLYICTVARAHRSRELSGADAVSDARADADSRANFRGCDADTQHSRKHAGEWLRRCARSAQRRHDQHADGRAGGAGRRRGHLADQHQRGRCDAALPHFPARVSSGRGWGGRGKGRGGRVLHLAAPKSFRRRSGFGEHQRGARGHLCGDGGLLLSDGALSAGDGSHHGLCRQPGVYGTVRRGSGAGQAATSQNL
eukprot:scaffold1858_cov261-Pinguiococcus_pyrenoidosus.AAC.5